MNGTKIIIACAISLISFKAIAGNNIINQLPCSAHKNCSIGVYATSPENRTGTKLIYAEIDEAKRAGNIIIYDNIAGKIIDKVKVNRLDPHNSANQYWENDDVFIYQDGYQDIFSYDTKKQEKTFHLYGKLAIKNVQGKVYLKKDKKNKNRVEPGVYEYDINKDREDLVITYSEIEDSLCDGKFGCKIIDIYNLKYNKEKNKIVLRADYKVKSKVSRQMLILDLNSFKLTKSELLVHFFVANNKIIGEKNRELVELDNNNQVARVKKLQVNHFDFFDGVIATDSWYDSKNIFLKLCLYEAEKCTTVFENNNSEIVWSKYYHVNPSFNYKGNKVFFNYPRNNGSVVAAYVNL